MSDMTFLKALLIIGSIFLIAHGHWVIALVILFCTLA